MKKKVGLVTIHDIYNYGSILQAYATQKSIEKMGYEVEIIDYKYPNEYHNRAGHIVNKSKAFALNYVNGFLKNLLPTGKESVYKNNYKKFKEENYNLSPNRYSNQGELVADPPAYDIYVSGSDQIWRPEFVKDDKCFFLDFVKEGKKISYASSFSSVSIPNEYLKTYAKYLEKYDHIGVREESGVKIIKKLINRDARLVLDPTMLLSKEEWNNVLIDFKSEEPYILCYGQNFGDGYMEKMAKEIAKSRNLKIVRLNGKFYDYFNKKMEFVLDAGPAEFLGLFKNAEVVLAQSFHATIFSLIFEREFIPILRGDSNHDTRQLNILKMLGLESRAMVVGDQFAKIDDFATLDYRNINLRIIEERNKSLEYLKNALED